MRITVCEIPDDAAPADSHWAALRSHTREHGTDLLLLPEFAFLPAVWKSQQPDLALWAETERRFRESIACLPELACRWVVGAGPATEAGTRRNRGFLWSSGSGLSVLRDKAYLPNEPGSWEANWFAPGGREFTVHAAGELRFGLHICTELWALDAVSRYPAQGVQALLTPRATAASSTERWIALARTLAVRIGAFSFSSNRRSADGSSGGTGWLIDPEGREIARTSAQEPFATREVDLAACAAARSSYPRYVFLDR